MTTYIKTRKGMDELLARRSTIDHRLNSLLLLIDGTRTRDALLAQLQVMHAPADSLEILLHGGYIEVQRAATVHRISTTDRSGAPSTEATSEAQRDTAAEASQTFYRYLVATAREQLGMRGLGMQLKIEQAGTAADLEALVAPLADAIAKRHGMDAAHGFMAEAQRMRRGMHASHAVRVTTGADDGAASAAPPAARSANWR